MSQAGAVTSKQKPFEINMKYVKEVLCKISLAKFKFNQIVRVRYQ